MSQGSAIRLTSQELARFFGKIQINKTTQCWEWTASKTPQGYAQINYQRRPMVAHRVSYRAFVGEIHRGLVIDHLCRVRHCVNPAHLEAVTHQVNIIRGNAPTAILARNNTCKNGHSYTEASTMTRADGGRTCRICFNEWHRNYMQSNPEQRARKTAYDCEYRRKNAARISQRRRTQREAVTDEMRAKDRKYGEKRRAKHGEAINAYRRDYYQANLEEMRIRHREYARQYRLRQKAKMAAVTADLPFLPATTEPPHTD